MLCGIGGRTIAEAKENMDVDEFAQWVAYRALRGSLNPGRRMEQSAAVVALQINNGNGGKARLVDFLPHEKQAVEVDDDEELTTDLLMKMLG
ncbi:hypothetical protein [Cellvibrio sp. KY-GH-1]|uniref:phage tail assembly protein T n=1 Tax=Cellvibrio sp. KY-GH-1 TaxID=2303332 RepID=UPI001CD9400C|nr:hypothetical protein [Cellvibrio sp. KY-GH-1]